MSFDMMYINHLQRQFEQMKVVVDVLLERISERELHMRPNEQSNSIAMVMQHMHGHMVAHFSAFFAKNGQQPLRNEMREFSVKPQSLSAIAAMWEYGWMVVFQTLRQLTPNQLLQVVERDGVCNVAFDTLQTQLAHYSYHIGQIVYIGKWLKGEDWVALTQRHIPIEQQESQNEQCMYATTASYDV